MTTNKSPFATTLRSIFDAPGGFKRCDWAELLGVSEAAISQWLHDETIPRPENMRAILDTAMEDKRLPDALLEELEDVLRRPAREVSPHGARMLPTVGHYLLRPLRDGAFRMLDTIASGAQEPLLLELASRCREARHRQQELRPVSERRTERWAAAVGQKTSHWRVAFKTRDLLLVEAIFLRGVEMRTVLSPSSVSKNTFPTVQAPNSGSALKFSFGGAQNPPAARNN